MPNHESNNANDASDPLDRYSRQVRFAPWGEAGQRELASSRALVCGCGALGSVIAGTLVRAGVGFVRIVDRDFLELSNLQRQVLFTEQDVAAGLPKSIAAAKHLQAINSQVEIDPVVADVTHGNIAEIAADIEVIVDGTDNFETRMLINDFSVSRGVPWIYGGCIGAEGQTMAVLPGETACLTCLMPELPPPGTTPTCETAGILGPAVNVIASLQSIEALKILSGNRKAVSRRLTVVDLWDNRVRQLDVGKLRAAGNCKTCAQRVFPWLEGKKGSDSVVLCGRNSVQVGAAAVGPISLDDLAKKLSEAGQLTRNPFLVRVAIDEQQLTVFADGRTIVSGTDNPSLARSLVARYIGN